MQSTSHLHPNSPPSFCPPWNPQKPQSLPTPINTKPSPRFPTLSNSLEASFNFDFKREKLSKEAKPTIQTSLPVVIRQSGSVSRYFWDGKDLNLVPVDGNARSCSPTFRFDDFEDGFRRLFRIFRLGVRDFFLPRKINGSYLEYVKWKFLHRVFSSALQVLATQAMFRAIGIGYARSLPSAAALNWVLKDGLGRFCRCIYTASLASAFDTNLKRVRFSTSVVFSLSIGLELMTPAFPQYFLLLASIANIAKQISLACYLATASAVHRSFAIADNLGEVSAKAQIQSVCFDNLGLMLAAVLNILLKTNQSLLAGLPFVVYPIFTAIDLYGIYQSLKHVHLQTLTKDRLEIILNTWVHWGYVPSPAEVSKEEGIDLFWSKGRQFWPIRIGCLNPKGQIPKLSMMTMRSLREEDSYFILVETCCRKFGSPAQPGILLCLREGACTADIIMGMLQVRPSSLVFVQFADSQRVRFVDLFSIYRNGIERSSAYCLLKACYTREGLLSRGWEWEEISEDCDGSHSTYGDWFKLVEDSKRSARGDIDVVNDKMLGLGWACKNILMSTQEQARFSFVYDRQSLS